MGSAEKRKLETPFDEIDAKRVKFNDSGSSTTASSTTPPKEEPREILIKGTGSQGVAAFLEKHKLRKAQAARGESDADSRVAELQSTTGLNVGDSIQVFWEVERASDEESAESVRCRDVVDVSNGQPESNSVDNDALDKPLQNEEDEVLQDNGEEMEIKVEHNMAYFYSSTVEFPPDDMPKTVKQFWELHKNELQDFFKSNNLYSDLEEVEGWVKSHGSSGLWMLEYHPDSDDEDEDEEGEHASSKDEKNLENSSAVKIENNDLNSPSSPNTEGDGKEKDESSKDANSSSCNGQLDQMKCLVFFPDTRHAVHIDYRYPSCWDKRPIIKPNEDESKARDEIEGEWNVTSDSENFDLEAILKSLNDGLPPEATIQVGNFDGSISISRTITFNHPQLGTSNILSRIKDYMSTDEGALSAFILPPEQIASLFNEEMANSSVPVYDASDNREDSGFPNSAPFPVLGSSSGSESSRPSDSDVLLKGGRDPKQKPGGDHEREKDPEC